MYFKNPDDSLTQPRDKQKRIRSGRGRGYQVPAQDERKMFKMAADTRYTRRFTAVFLSSSRCSIDLSLIFVNVLNARASGVTLGYVCVTSFANNREPSFYASLFLSKVFVLFSILFSYSLLLFFSLFLSFPNLSVI